MTTISPQRTSELCRTGAARPIVIERIEAAYAAAIENAR
jgi:hypothetical protein